MRYFLLLSLLAIPALSVVRDCSATNTDPTKYDAVLMSDGTNCMCKCLSDLTDQCTTWDTLLTDITATVQTDALLDFTSACATNNQFASKDRCGWNFISFDETALRCTCPICDQRTKCDQTYKPNCNNAGECVKGECTVAADPDANGNYIATVSQVTVDISLCGGSCPTSNTCTYSKPTFVNDGTNCVCSCQSGADVCVTWDVIKPEIATGGHNVQALIMACGETNSLLSKTSNREYTTFDETATSCTCPIVDQSAICETVNAEAAFCDSTAQLCKKRTCTTATDSNNNVIATTTVETSDACAESCTTATTCPNYGTDPELNTDAATDDCVCACLSDGTEGCITLTDIKTDIAAGAAALTTNLEAFTAACGVTNKALATCGDSLSFPADTTDLGCADSCPICDKTAQCDVYNARDPFCKDGACVKKKCTTTTDEFGNISPSFEYLTVDDAGDAFVCVDADGVTDTCEVDECDADGVYATDAFCWFRCVLHSDGIRRRKFYGRIEEIATNIDALNTLKEICLARNPGLDGVYPANIVPVAFSADAPGCGCGIRREKCDFLDAYYHLVKLSDTGEAVCKETKCEETTTTATDDAGNEYTNTVRTVTKTTVDTTLCETVTIKRTPSPVSDTLCSSGSLSTLCQDATDDSLVCVTTADGKTFTTCKERVACMNLDATEYTLASGRCTIAEVTEDQCEVVGAISVKEENDRLSGCPRICECFLKDGVKVEVCGSIRSEYLFPILKEKCPDQLGEDACVFSLMQYKECPLSTDDNFCEKLFCSTDVDPTDLSGDALCVRSSEGFEDATAVSVPTDDSGCKYCECADDGSNTLVCKRYDQDTDTSAGIRRRCPELETCSSALAYELNGLCGQCPVCPADGVDDDCDDEMLRSGDAACKEDPAADDTRAADDTIEARVKLVIGARVCVDDFLSRTRSEVYGYIKKAALKIVEDECSIDLLKLRAYIVSFEFAFGEAVNNEDCTMVASFKAVLHFSDVDIARLRALKECLLAILDAIPAKVRAALIYVTKDTRLAIDATTGETTTNSEGDIVYESAGVDPDIELLDSDGLNTLADATTAAPDDDATTEEGGGFAPEQSSAAGWFVVGAMIASCIALLF